MKKKQFVALTLLAMRVTAIQFLLIILFATTLYAKKGSAQEILEKKINLSADQWELTKVISNLQTQTGINFIYSPNAIGASRKISCRAVEKRLGDFLEEQLKPIQVGYRIVDKQILLFAEPNALDRTDGSKEAVLPDNHSDQKANRIIRGQVLGENGQPLAGVNITVKNLKIGTTTDEMGNFQLTVPDEYNTIQISAVGYESKEVVVGPDGVATVTLKILNKNLDEVIVVGYGTQKKVSVTAAISSVQPKEILRSPVSSVANAIAGRTTGVVAVQRGGEPGRDIADIFVRGIGTFNSTANARPLVLVDGVERSLAGIDPYTIESFNILKDASATAVFGVRGANGVIMITTKTGDKGKPQISFSSNFAWQNPIRLPDLLNAEEYAVLRNEAEANDANNPNARKFSEYDIERFRKGDDPYFHPNIDWMDYMLKDFAPQQLYNLNISGGSSDAKYFVSLGYLNQDGIYELGDFFKEFSANPNFKRYNIRSNFDFNITDKLTVMFKASSEIGNSNYSNSNTSDIFSTILSANPMMNPVVYDGRMIRNVEGLTAFQISNAPLYQMLFNGFNTNFSSRLNTNLALRYKLDGITKGLLFRAMVAYDSYYLQQVRRSKQIPMYDLRYNRNATNFQDSIVPIPVVNQFEGPVSFLGESFVRNRKTYGEAALEYNRKFGDHSVSALVLGMMERFYDGGATPQPQLPFNYLGLVSRLSYNYRGKYLAEVNMGYNGSENFAVGRQFGFFPAFSVGYIVSQEKFFPKSDAFNYLKLRASYGEVGNDKLAPFRFLFQPSSFVPGGNYFFGINNTASVGYRENSLGNPNVSWEVARKINLGADFQFFRGSLTFSADLFSENRDKILWNLNVPVTFGAPGLIAPYNIGQAENKGYEFELGYRSNKTGDFRYSVNANYSFARNKIIYMDEVPQPYPGLVMTGNRIGQPKGLIAEGLFNTMDEINDPKRPKSIWEGNGLRPGDIRYKDVNEDGFIDDNDRVNMGFPNIPEIVYGATFNLGWKNFELSVFFQGAEHVSTYLTGEAAWPFIAGTKAAFENARESWSQERYDRGDRITLPRLTASPEATKHNYRTSTFWQQDASYLRLKNIELGYTVQAPGMQKAGIKMLRFYASAQNLITWTSMRYFDPEIPNSNGAIYPMTRIFNLGFNLQF